MSIDAAFAADAKQAAPKRSEAEAFLLDYLKNGSKYAGQMYKDAESEGISGGTLRLALKAIKAETYKDSGAGGQWLWKLSNTSPDTTEVAKVDKVAKGANHSDILATSTEPSSNGLSREQLDSSSTYSNISDFGDLPGDDSEPDRPTGTDGRVKF